MAGRQVALIRGINVGRAKRVAMADLRVLMAELGYRDVRTLLNSGSRLLVFVLSNPADISKLKPLTERKWAPEAFAIGRRAAYLWCPTGIIDSPLATALGKILGDSVTSRNWATMTKLHALVAG